MKTKIYRICKYLIVLVICVWSIYNIVFYSLKLKKDYNGAFLLGIIIYSMILLVSIICFVLLIKKEIYRRKFTHNDYE